MSDAPQPNPQPVPRFESLGSSDVAICTDDGCTIPEVGGEPVRSEPAESERPPGRPSSKRDRRR